MRGIHALGTCRTLFGTQTSPKRREDALDARFKAEDMVTNLLTTPLLALSFGLNTLIAQSLGSGNLMMAAVIET